MMKSIEKLRVIAEYIYTNNMQIIDLDHLDVIGSFMLRPEWLDSWHKAFDAACDEIEREISERYMELPVDDDGVPIRVGDEINSLGCGVLVNSIIWDGTNWYASEVVASSDWFPVKHSEHAKPRTLEDVLEEFAHKAVRIGMAGGVPCDAEFYVDKDAIAEYAAEIRELMGVDE